MRELLADARRSGLPFPEVWPAALEVLEDDELADAAAQLHCVAKRLETSAGVGLRAAEGGQEDKPKALTRAEFALVVEALPAEWRLLFEFLTHTGLRISEAIGLTWEHVDLGTRPTAATATGARVPRCARPPWVRS